MGAPLAKVLGEERGIFKKNTGPLKRIFQKRVQPTGTLPTASGKCQAGLVFGSCNALRPEETPDLTSVFEGQRKTFHWRCGRPKIQGSAIAGDSHVNMKRMTFNNTAKVLSILMLAAAYVVMGASTCKPVVGVTCRGVDDPLQYIVNLVNTESGATQVLQAGEITWTYSMAVAGPCTLYLTEELQRVNTARGSSPTAPVREVTHYLIPLADLNLGPLGTRIELGRPGSVMQVIIATQHATIRRWHGDSATMPPDAPVAYEAPIRFGKPNVDIFVVTVRLENALRSLAPFCGATARPDSDPFGPR